MKYNFEFLVINGYISIKVNPSTKKPCFSKKAILKSINKIFNVKFSDMRHMLKTNATIYTNMDIKK